LTLFSIDPVFYDTWDKSPVSLLCRWDCGWYLNLAEHGYLARTTTAAQPGASNMAFFPLYPMLMEAVHGMAGVSRASAGVIVSNLALVAALVYVHRYALLLGFSSTVGLLAVAILCFVPHGFVFSAVYTESLFMLLLAAAMYHLRKEHFLLAGLLAAALSAVRANGIFFLFFALFWLVRTQGVAPLLRPWRRPELFVPIVFAPIGLFCFWAYCLDLS